MFILALLNREKRSLVPIQGLRAHGIAMVVCGMLAVVIFCLRVGGGYNDWKDAVWYLASAKQMVVYGLFPSGFLEYYDLAPTLEEGVPSTYVAYSNIGFLLLLGFWSLVSGQFSLINGIYIAGLFTVLTAFAVYGFSNFVLRDKAMAVLVVAGVLLHKHVFHMSARPLTDIALLFFFILAAWAMVSDRPLLSGFALALGFLIREPAMLYFPLIPLLSPQCNSIKQYARITLKMGSCFFMCGPLVALLFKQIVMHEPQAQNFYSEWLAQVLNRGRSLKAEQVLNTFLHSCIHYIKSVGIVLFMVLLCVAIMLNRADKLVVRLCVVSLAVAYPLIDWGLRQRGIDPRYYIYSVPLLVLAAAVSFQRSKYKFLLMGILVAALCFPSSYRRKGSIRSLVTHPVEYFTRVQHYVDAPFAALASFMPQRAVLLCEQRHMAQVSLDNPVCVRVPAYEDFMQGRNNHLLDGILLHFPAASGENQLNWPNSPFILDHAGVKFERIYEHGLFTLFRRVPPPQ